HLEAEAIAAGAEIGSDRRGHDEEAIALRRPDADIAVGGGHDRPHIERVAGPGRDPSRVDARERGNRLDEHVRGNRRDAQARAGGGEARGVAVRSEETEYAVIAAVDLE